MGWLAQPLYLLVLLWFLISKARDVCARCQFYDQWHCGGLGKAAARVASVREDPISMHRSQKHYALLFLVLLGLWLGLFNLDMMAGIAGVVWTVVAAVAAIPRAREYSWKIGRSELARRVEHPLDIQTSEDGVASLGIHTKGRTLSYSEGIELIPLSLEEENGDIEKGEVPGGPKD
jgi:hypothetical protein